MKEPKVINIVSTDNASELTIIFAADAEYLEGHFPGFPVVPGVAQVHWAAEFAARLLKEELNIIQMQSIKFSRIIMPGAAVTLNLDCNRLKKQIRYSYSGAEGIKYSSGRLVWE